MTPLCVDDIPGDDMESARRIATILLARTELHVVETGPADAAWTFVHVHANERASLQSAIGNAERLSLRVRVLTHGGGRHRNIRFTGTQGNELALDPNRMFSEVGVRESLRDLNGGASFTDTDVSNATSAGSQLLTALTSDSRTWCALHNNTDGGGLTICYYTESPGSSVAEDVHVAGEYDADDFFYTTSRSLFEALKGASTNVVLQAQNVADDGSLSVIAAQRSIPYLNIETEHHHPARATRMLEIGVAALASSGVR